MSRGLQALLLIGLVATATLHRVHRAQDQSGWPDPVQLYRSEAAVHYRYAEVLSESGAIPDTDLGMETPHGVIPAQDFTLFLEWTVATSARVIRALPGSDHVSLPLVVAWVIAFLTSLSIAFVFLVALRFQGSFGGAWISAAIMAIAAPNWLRGSGAFIRENLAVPLVLAALYAAVRDEEARTVGSRALVVVLLIAFLSSWHLAGFVLAAASLPAWLDAVKERRSSRLLGSISVAALAAGLLSDPLVSRGFLWSGVGAFLLAGGLFAWAVERWGRSVAWLPVAGLVWVAAGAGGDYGHVYEVLVARLSGRSSDEMSWVARAFSTGPFGAVTPHHFLERWLVPFLAGLIGWLAILRGGDNGKRWMWLGLITLGFGICSILMTRFSVLWIPALAIAAGGAWGDRQLRWILIPVMGLGLHVMAAWPAGPGFLQWIRPLAVVAHRTAVPIPAASRDGVYRWIKANTHRDAVICADFADSPSHLLATGRPIALHPMFERSSARDRVHAYHEALNGDIDGFREFCVMTATDYVVLDVNAWLDESLSGLRGLSGVSEIATDCALTRIWFSPESVDWVVPVYQDAWNVVLAANTGHYAYGGGPLPRPCAGRVAFDASRYPNLLDEPTVNPLHLNRMRADLLTGLGLLRRCMGIAGAGDQQRLENCLTQARFFLPCHPVIEAMNRQAVTPAGSPD